MSKGLMELGWAQAAPTVHKYLCGQYLWSFFNWPAPLPGHLSWGDGLACLRESGFSVFRFYQVFSGLSQVQMALLRGGIYSP